MTVRYWLRTLVVFLLVLISRADKAQAQDEGFTSFLTGNIQTGDSCLVIDDKFRDLPDSLWNRISVQSVSNVISFELRSDTNIYYYNQPFTCTLNVTINYYNSRDLVREKYENINLVVHYDTATGQFYPAEARYTFNDAYKVSVVVNSITSTELGSTPPAIFRLRNQVLIKRTYPFSPNILGRVDMGLNGTDPNKLDVSWPPDLFTSLPLSFGLPQEYDVEWVYIDAKSDRAIEMGASPYSTITNGKLAEWMRFDASRVTVKESHYSINLSYPTGFVIVRVRGASYDPITGLRLTTNWVYRNAANQIACHLIDDGDGHQENLNWQYTATFAEEGKRKDVMSYFDGGLKSRQTVTVNNADNTAMIAETVYDRLGRPAISILPSPVIDQSTVGATLDYDNKIKYYPNVNKNNSGQTYSYTDVADQVNNDCSPIAKPLDNSDGAGNYYSSANPYRNRINDPRFYFTKNVPDAGHIGDYYAFASTEYMPDNTGRIRRQGGVGYDFRIGGGHDTRYFYGKPTPMSLYRLFGMEVGNASHYLKNMVIDANGQASVSYMDASGKTIATALAGKAPAALDPLASSTKPEATIRLNDVLIRPADMQVNAGNLTTEGAATFLAATQGDFELHYEVNPATLVTNYGSNGKICNNCAYEMVIEVKDDCGDPVPPSSATPINVFTGNDITCYTNQTPFTGTIILPITKAGQYFVTYRLKLNEDEIKTQVDHYIATNTDLKQLRQFFMEELNKIDLKGCYNECKDCAEKLGSYSDFANKMKALIEELRDAKFSAYANLLDLNADPIKLELETWMTNTYSDLLSNCATIAAECTNNQVSPCEEFRQRMIQDVLPGGQYALIDRDPTTGILSIHADATGVLHFYNTEPDPSDGIALDIYNFEYTNKFGNLIQRRTLSVDEFLREYLEHPEWADKFLLKHPEYCNLEFCSTYGSQTYQFDQHLREGVKDGQDAINNGYYNSISYSYILDLEKDPFFASGGLGEGLKWDMMNDLANASTVLNMTPVGSPAKNIQQLIDWILYCAPTDPNISSTDFATIWNGCTPSTGCRSLNREWDLYRQYYQRLKSKYVLQKIKEWNSGCFNCHIGASAECTSTTPTPIACPQIGDFEIIRSHIGSDGTTCNQIFEWKIVYKPGGSLAPVPRNVILRYLKYESATSSDPGYFEADFVEMEAGHSEVILGNLTDYECEEIFGFYDWNPSAPLECEESPGTPSTCAPDPNAQVYLTKQRVWDEYTLPVVNSNCNVPPSTPNASGDLASMKTRAITELPAQKQIWKDKLKAVVEAENEADEIAGINPARFSTLINGTAIDNLADDLEDIALKIINDHTDISKPITIYSSLPPGVTVNGQHDFKDAFIANIGVTLVHKGFGPDLLETPYPWNITPAISNPNISDLNSEICAKLSALYTLYQNIPGVTGTVAAFTIYLKQELGTDFKLTEAQVTELINKCSGTCKVLSNPMILPAVLTPGTNSWADCATMNTKKTAFNNEYPDIQVDTRIYRVLLTNYLNHQLGFSLAYEDYNNFFLKCNSQPNSYVFNKPQYPLVEIAENGCASDLFASVLDKSFQEYTAYIEEIRRVTRNRFISKCLNTKTSVNLEADQFEYHYTLYYYDQSGNLVKTVPPEGVKPLNAQQVTDVLAFYDAEEASCSAQGIPSTGDINAIFNNFESGLSSNSARSIEMWMQSTAPGTTRQVRILTPDKKFFYQAAIYQGKLWAEIYKMEPVGTNEMSIVSSSIATADISNFAPLQDWSHLVIQSGTSLSTGDLQLFLDGRKLTNMTGAPIPGYPFEWEIDPTTGGFGLPALKVDELKHFRVYNRLLTENEVWENYRSPCMTLEEGLAQEIVTVASPLIVWGRFNVPMPGAPGTTTSPNDGSLELTGEPVTIPDIEHYIPSVSNNFTMEFWVNPTATVSLQEENTTGYNGMASGQRYAIFPRHGANVMADISHVGISVGTNGINVSELAYNYIPVLLSWSGTINGWTHVAVVYEDKTPRLYINGVFVKSGLTSLKNNIYPSYNFTGGPYGTMLGRMDEVRIWNYSMSGSQLQANMHRGIAPPTTGLVGYWPMSPTNGTAAVDISGFANNYALETGNWQWSNNATDVMAVNVVETVPHLIVPHHQLPTVYAYNSLNQVVKQTSPDGGTSEFWYDRLGRLTISQNAEQKQPQEVSVDNPANRYSYTEYDAIGRIIEVGEKLDVASVTEETMRNPAALALWKLSGTKRQITVTAYDKAPAWVPGSLYGKQYNLRKRVAATALLSESPSTVDPAVNRLAASYYSYDIMGNVSVLVQENTALKTAEAAHITGGTGLKTIKYEYDLVSGKVNKVLYQDGKWDQFYYRYEYDAENRLTKALSSRQNNMHFDNMWVNEASYRYYMHGPLARTELGHNRVQGIDYAYTLQGWIKGVNSQKLDATRDMGGDGNAATPFKDNARDAFGFSLNYFGGDYTPIESSLTAFSLQRPEPAYDPSGTVRNLSSGKFLYNGNISAATYAMRGIDNGNWKGYTYRYDQLNRLTGMDQHDIAGNATSWGTGVLSGHYREQISYDANGNINTYGRNGNTGNATATGWDMDDLSYRYYYYTAEGQRKEYNKTAPMPGDAYRLTNQLASVKDDLSLAANYSVDIDNQSDANYQYDHIGNLVSDEDGKIDRINWNVYGKIASIEKKAGETNKDISYGYDATGNRITKTVSGGNGISAGSTFYVRDAQGNTLGVYSFESGTQTKYKWEEQNLYGSSRLGLLKPGLEISSSGILLNDGYTEATDPAKNGNLGQRIFELSNHLGNVLVTISDKKIGEDEAHDGVVDYYVADVKTANDYYPFGMQMPGRDNFSGTGYRYGFNTQEQSNEIDPAGNNMTAEFWQYDARIARRWNVDPVVKEFESVYSTFGSNPILYKDEKGDDKYKIHENGKIQRVRTKDKFDQFFVYKDNDGDGDKEWTQVAQFNKNDKGLIALPKSFKYENWGWNYTGSAGENFVSGSAMAGVIGALRSAGEVVSFNHWSASDGHSPSPSKSHVGGTVGDVRPLRKDRAGTRTLVSDFQFDKDANSKLVKAFKLFGWTSVLSERYNGWITPGTTHYSAARHNDHYHIQRYQPKIENISDFNIEPAPTTEPRWRLQFFKYVKLTGFTLKSGIIFRGNNVIKQ